MEFAVGGFVGLLDALDGFDDVEGFDEARVEVSDIADATDEGLHRALRNVRFDIFGAQEGLEVFDLCGVCVFFD